MEGFVYVAGDLHGCEDKYIKMIEEVIKLSDRDKLYLLGDVLDRGPEPIRILQDVMQRKNVELILGNHEKFALDVLPCERFIWYSPLSYEKPFFEEPNRFLVFGHTPTFRVADYGSDAKAGNIFIKNNYIAVDCGCVFEKYRKGRFGCLRLNDMKEFYV